MQVTNPSPSNEVLANCVDKLEHTVYGNGQPGIETRITQKMGDLKSEIMQVFSEGIGNLKARTDQVERHADNNIKEGDGLVLEAVRQETIERKAQHAENARMYEIDRGERREFEATSRKFQTRMIQILSSFAIAMTLIEGLEKLHIIQFIGGK